MDIDLNSIPATSIRRSNRLRDSYSTAAVRVEIRILESVVVNVTCGGITLRDYRTNL